MNHSRELKSLLNFTLGKTRSILDTRGFVAAFAILIAVVVLAFIGLVQNFVPIVAILTIFALTYALGKGVIAAWRANQRKEYIERAKTQFPIS